MRLRRGTLQHVQLDDERSGVLVDGQVVELSEIAAAILRATPPDGSATLPEVTSTVVAELGAPPPPLDADEVVAAQVHQLVAHGVLIDTEEAVPPAGATAEAVAALRGCLRHLLSDAPGTWVLPEGVSGDQLLLAGRRHRVVPLLARSADRLDLPAPVAARIVVAGAQERATVTQLAHDLARATDALDTAGVRSLTFKGLALAVQAHGDVGARGTGDLDLLVHPRDLGRAHRALVDAGWAPDPGYPAPGPSWAWRHLERTGNELSLSSSTSTVDLHWHLTPARSVFPDFDGLWRRAARVDVLGREVATLAAYDALAHSAAHSAKDGWHWLRGIVDVHRLVADPLTWRDVDRPLRHDQLLTVGLAARMFGTPAGAPAVVDDAATHAAAVWDDAVRRQAGGAATHRPTRVPGVTLVRGVRGLRRAGADGADLWRHLSHSAFPEWLTAEEPSEHAAIAVPRVLARRAAAFARRARQARGDIS